MFMLYVFTFSSGTPKHQLRKCHQANLWSEHSHDTVAFSPEFGSFELELNRTQPKSTNVKSKTAQMQPTQTETCWPTTLVAKAVVWHCSMHRLLQRLRGRCAVCSSSKTHSGTMLNESFSGIESKTSGWTMGVEVLQLRGWTMQQWAPSRAGSPAGPCVSWQDPARLGHGPKRVGEALRVEVLQLRCCCPARKKRPCASRSGAARNR